MSLSMLAERAAALGVSLSPEQLAAFAAYRDELLAWNERVNLTSIRDPAEVELRHFVDSISCLAALPDLLEAGRQARLIDVGSGAGFPGLPLKLVCPDIR